MTEKIRVVEVCHSWPAETFIQRHAEALAATGFSVQLVARHRIVSSQQHASIGDENQRINVEILPNFNHLGSLEKLLSLRYIARLGSSAGADRLPSEKVMLGYFKHLKPDLVHFHDASLAALMAWIPKTLGIPYTLSVRGSDVQVLPNESEQQKNRIAGALKGARKIHAVCDHLATVAQGLAGSPLDVQTIYTTIPFPAQLPDWSGIGPESECHFVSTGRLVWQKSFTTLLMAFRQLLDQGEKARLTIIGSGPAWDELLHTRKLLGLEAQVALLGKLSYDEMTATLRSAHAYIQPSMMEGLNNALLEAIASGLPVFATNVGGTCEIITDGVTGFLLEPLAPQNWAGTLTRLRDHALMEQVRAAAFRQAQQMFSADHHAQAFRAFFEEAVCSNP